MNLDNVRVQRIVHEADQRKRLDHIIAELSRYSGKQKAVEGGLMVCCPFHHDKTPSFRISTRATSRSPGYGKCYGCGVSKKWDEYAGELQLKPYQWEKPKAEFARPMSTKTGVSVGDDSDFFHFEPLPKDKRWRSIPTNLLIKIGCKIIHQYGKKLIYMPVRIGGEERGYIRARVRKELGEPSYLNKPGPWSKDYGLFPLDYALKMNGKVLVLVEGPRDALRLIDNGIPAVAVLGTQSWSKKKSELLEILGVNSVILCFDGDPAGVEAEKKARKLLKPFVSSSTFSLCGEDSPYWKFRKKYDPSKSAKKAGVELWDPGNMPARKIKQLYAEYKTVNKMVRKENDD